MNADGDVLLRGVVYIPTTPLFEEDREKWEGTGDALHLALPCQQTRSFQRQRLRVSDIGIQLPNFGAKTENEDWYLVA